MAKKKKHANKTLFWDTSAILNVVGNHQLNVTTIKRAQLRLLKDDPKFPLHVVRAYIASRSAANALSNYQCQNDHSETDAGAGACSMPPINAQFLLDLFLPEERCEEFIGDLQERYNRKLIRLDPKRAGLWYYKQVVTSILPIGYASLRQLAKGSLSHIFCWILRLLGQASWADTLKSAAKRERKQNI